MQPHDGRLRKFRMSTRWPHQRSEGTRGNRGWKKAERRTACSYRSCDDPITASVLAGATRITVCFTHEREYADRYGPADIYPLAP